MKTANVPFPVGTVRGPFRSDSERGKNTKVQFCVQTPGGWVYFIKWAHEEGEVRKEAEAYSAKVLSETTASSVPAPADSDTCIGEASMSDPYLDYIDSRRASPSWLPAPTGVTGTRLA